MEGVTKTQHVLWFDDCTTDLAHRIGGKALGLGVLLNHGFAVPPGFTVTTDAYQACVTAADLTDRIAEILDQTSNNREASEQISTLFTEDMLTDDVAAAITNAYEQLGGADVAVAVRSSATAEDMAEASFAGQQETYLWVRGAEEVRKHVIRCWASLFTQRAIDYRARIEIPLEGLAMGVVVQQMVPAEAAGVIMTLHPVSGNRSQIYIESAFGLGEIVVRGEVDADRFCVDKKALSIVSKEIGNKERAYHFDEGEVRLVDVPASEREQESLSESEVRAAAELARQVEDHFGKPMEIEWAIATNPDSGEREPFLLQARPETIWSNRPAPVSPEKVRGRFDGWDNLQSWTDPGRHWTTSIVGEDIPGVATPLCWSLWSHALELCARDSGYRMGVLTHAERRVPDRMEDRFVRISYGRVAAQIEYLTMLGDRMPGTSGAEVAESLFGRVPESIEFQPTSRRYPIIAWRFPWAFLSGPFRIRRVAREFDAWYEETVARLPNLGDEEAVALFHEAAERFETAMKEQTIGLLAIVQPTLRRPRETGREDRRRRHLHLDRPDRGSRARGRPRQLEGLPRGVGRRAGRSPARLPRP